ncbi:MAG: LytTR family DNA-binding domain-containing protein [Bacteroidetes bacterium]|nr:LytTR family DNA-binding domain-containing protein [Bacteroidota bacterium]
MNSIKTIIVEDDIANHRRLKQLLEKYCENIQIVGVAETKEAAIKMIEVNSPDLVFLDIELPDGNGFEILNHFIPISFKIIFCTGHQEHAYQAIKFHAVDYLLKPVNITELINAVKFVPPIEMDDGYRNKIEGFRRQIIDPDKITLIDSAGFKVLETSEIIKLEANINYTDIYLVENRKLTYCKILKEFEDLLKFHKNFIRTHRSFIVNLDHVKSFSRQGIIKLTGEQVAHCGDSYKEEFLSHFIQPG